MMELHSSAKSDSNASIFASFLFPQENGGQSCPYIDVIETDDDLSNVTPLHIAATYNCTEIASLLIRHARELDGEGSNVRLKKLLTCRDLESGYTALHRALLAGNIQMSWFLFSSGYLVVRWEDYIDHEGYNPLDMLSQTLRHSLKDCRENIVEKKSKIRNLIGRERSKSLADIIYDNGHQSDVEEVSHGNDNVRNACEVMTYGRTNHFALGIAKFSQGNEQDLSSNRPKRVPCFAVGDGPFVNDSGSAIAIASAAYHSLILTKTGHLYTCGYGKGGRLGTANDKDHPTPVRIMGALEKRKVVSIAAAENHSLVCTQEGKVYAWGSNRFGQLGSSSGNGSSVSSTIRLLPRKIEDLKKSFIVKVAAGSRHSVCLTRQGEVLTWGDNSLGQLGVNGSCGNGKIHSVSYLWNAEPVKVAFDITAGEQSTLVLTKANNRSVVNNSLYEWGHGVNHPSKVTFPHINDGTGRIATRSVNPVAMSSGKHHSVALTEDGRVYSWGFHSESLGTKKVPGSLSTSRSMGSPHLIKSLSSEFVVSISASDDHTAVVTDTGDLFTFGTSDKDIFGHEGVKFQPSPKKVAGVKRVISVAAAREHTILLVGTSFPKTLSIPHDDIPYNEKLRVTTMPTLQQLCGDQIMKHIDIFNASSLLFRAEYLYCKELAEYCLDFIRLNYDGVITLNKRKDLEQLSMFISSTSSSDHDQHEVSQTIRLAKDECQQSVITLRCKRLVASFSPDLCKPELLKSKHKVVAKELRGLSKKFHNCVELEKSGKSLSKDQREKLSRRPVLEECIKVLKPVLSAIEARMEHYNVAISTEITPSIENIRTIVQESLEEEIIHKSDDSTQAVDSELPIYRCDVCNICCPDQSSLAFHLSGKKHRNRVNRIEEEDRAVTLKALENKNVYTSTNYSCQAVGARSSKDPDTMSSVHKQRVKALKAPSFQEILDQEAKMQQPLQSKRSPRHERIQGRSHKITANSAIWSNASPMFTQNRNQSLPCKTKASHPSSPWAFKRESKQSLVKPVEHKQHNQNQQQLQNFHDILQEEQERKSTEDNRGVASSKWFLEQRERAGSLSAIIEQEAEMERLIEEQRLIEAQIRASLDVDKSKQKSADKRKKNRNRQAKTNNSNKKISERPNRTKLKKKFVNP